VAKCPTNENVIAAAILQERWRQAVRAHYLVAREKGLTNAVLLKHSAETALKIMNVEIREVQGLLNAASLRRYRFKSASLAVQTLKEVCATAEAEVANDGVYGHADDPYEFLELFLTLVLRTSLDPDPTSSRGSRSR
jgi:hypothetical protein